MNRRTWKRSGRRMAAALGGKRVPVSGRARGDQPDVEHARFCIEVKSGRVMSARMLAAGDQAVAAEASGKIPMVAIEQSAGRGHLRRQFVLLRLEDWLALAPASSASI